MSIANLKVNFCFFANEFFTFLLEKLNNILQILGLEKISLAYQKNI